jgi:sugar (pentulose or hexulose) kinase
VLVHNREWMQLTADALARPLTTGHGEASLRGAAVTALAALGVSPEPPELGPVIEPRAELVDAYAAARERHRRLYDAAT